MSATVQTFGVKEIESLFASLGVQPHPMVKLPTVDQVNSLLAAEGGKERLLDFLKKRQLRIQLAEQDPLNWGWELETWVDADRLLGAGTEILQKATKETKGAEAEEVDCYLLGIFGGNRATKSWYAIKRAVQTADMFPQARLAILAESETASITTVQAQCWYYLQPKYGHLNGKRDPIFKINFTQAGGFTERKLVLPNRSEIYFLTYNQNPGDYEGWEFGAPAFTYDRMAQELRRQAKFVPPNVGAMADESMPLSWLHMFSRRLKFRKAKLLWPFTPVKGITPAIKELVGSSAKTIESRPSELLPRQNFPDLPQGHMPYIRRCVYPGAHAIYFFTQYNVFGPSPGRTYYDEIRQLCEGKTSEYVERVAYGVARDSVARAFPTFGPWNIVKRSQLPQLGTNYQFTDPAGARNWATIWVRVSTGNPPSLYIYRDWPDAQTYGEWAVPTEREVNEENRKGWDGDPGPAQVGMGFGVTKYKQTFLEAEKVLPRNMRNTRMGEAGQNADPYHVRLIERAKRRGEDLETLREEIAERYVDPRAGASEHMAEKGGTCIIDEFSEVQYEESTGRVLGPSMELIPASGVNQDEGLTAVNELLAWNQAQPLMPVVNQPHLFVSEDCLQVRWMFENFTGRSGEKGACKDFADLVRYMALAKLEYVDAVLMKGKPGRGW